MKASEIRSLSAEERSKKLAELKELSNLNKLIPKEVTDYGKKPQKNQNRYCNIRQNG